MFRYSQIHIKRRLHQISFHFPANSPPTASEHFRTHTHNWYLCSSISVPSSWKCTFSATNGRACSLLGHGSVEVWVLLKGNEHINLKEDNGGRKAHVKFSLLITTSHTMGTLPHRAQPEMWRSLSCFKLSPSQNSQPGYYHFRSYY